jgi:hypothetical protein
MTPEEDFNTSRVPDCPRCYNTEAVRLVDVLIRDMCEYTSLSFATEPVWECDRCKVRYFERSYASQSAYPHTLSETIRFDAYSHPAVFNRNEIDNNYIAVNQTLCEMEQKVAEVEQKLVGVEQTIITTDFSSLRQKILEFSLK